MTLTPFSARFSSYEGSGPFAPPVFLSFQKILKQSPDFMSSHTVGAWGHVFHFSFLWKSFYENEAIA